MTYIYMMIILRKRGKVNPLYVGKSFRIIRLSGPYT